MAWQYSDKTKQLFMDAVNGKAGTHLGEIEEPDGLGEHGSIACGDALRFTFRVEKHPSDPVQDVITDAKYLTFGCTSAIAASEALCILLEGRKHTPISALKIKNQDIVDHLGGLPEQKIHCSVMGAEALQAAVEDWAKKRGVDLEAQGVQLHADESHEGRLICKCFELTEPYLKRQIKELKLRTIPEITNAVKAGGACGSCHEDLQVILDGIWGKSPDRTAPLPEERPLTQSLPEEAEKPQLTPYQFAKRVDEVIDRNVRPVLKKDGGDIEIIDIKDKLVYCRLEGSCQSCAFAGSTLKMVVERMLKERLDDEVRVIEV